MHLHFEQNTSSRTECTIHSLSWMGKVPDTQSQPWGSGKTQEASPATDGGQGNNGNGGWKLNKSQYYSEGWLASGNAKGIVGVTFTASHCRKYEPPNRSNFNLRGHRSEVVLVRWNEPYQKLATCDAQGIIFVWIKHEGRWSIELINDRNSQVTDFAWSHDGRMALICYCDGFVLVGSVAGQRYWSSMLNLDNTAITCGVWSPDDQKVMFGTTDGQIIVMSSTGAMLTQVTVLENMEISCLLWSCEKFNMEENSASSESTVRVTCDKEDGSSLLDDKVYTLAVCFKYGAIYFMDNYDDICPKIVHSMLTGLKIDWSNCGEYLAVGGFTRLPNLLCQNEIHFYTTSGELAHWVSVPSQGKPLTALCWGHNDRRLFVATGHNLHVAWVVKHVPTLQSLCQHRVQRLVRQDFNVEKLPLPTKLCSNVKAFFTPTIKSYIPDPFKLRPFVSTPPPASERLFCTMIHHGEEASGGHYTLYLEYLGGLIPLLKGKRASKLRPDFIIFDPKIKAKRKDETVMQYEAEVWSDSTTSDSDIETDGCGGSPRVPRRKRLKKFRADRVERSTTFRTLNELFYNDNLPESSKLVEVLSNIWGTKFRIVGTAAHLPEDLGNVLYKTSLLHLQPRQMTVTVAELPRDDSLLAQDPNFTPAGAGDEEQDGMSLLDGLLSGVHNEHFMKFSIPNQLENLTNQDSDIISVDVLTNHMELSNNHSDNGSDNGSLVNCYPDRQKSVCMKTKLSPASETHPQNNHAFNTGEDPLIINTCMYGGARPKVPLHTPYNTKQTISDEAGVVGMTVSSNLVNGSKLYSCVDSNSAKTSAVSSQSENSNKSHVPDSHAMQKSSSAIVGDYFFTNGECNHSDLTGKEVLVSTTPSPDSVNTSVSKQVPSLVDRHIWTENQNNVPRWADPACQGIKYADDDEQSSRELVFEGNIVFDSSRVLTPTSDNQRLYLEPETEHSINSAEVSQDKNGSSDYRSASYIGTGVQNRPVGDGQKMPNGHGRPKSECGRKMPQCQQELSGESTKIPDDLKEKEKRGSIGSCNGDVVYNKGQCINVNDNLPVNNSSHNKKNNSNRNSKKNATTKVLNSKHSNGSLLSDFERLDIMQTASLPSSPIRRLNMPDTPTKKLREEVIHGKCKHHSPLFKRKSKYSRTLETSDDDDASSMEDVQISSNYKNLESFQKAQLKQKLRRALNKGERAQVNRRFVLHNKAPLWNENSQVYQLDFGGRVTQESAKNFQVEHRGKQVMQFGRIDSNAYTLDFQYPFTAIQAFAVALANVTQRLK